MNQFLYWECARELTEDMRTLYRENLGRLQTPVPWQTLAPKENHGEWAGIFQKDLEVDERAID